MYFISPDIKCVRLELQNLPKTHFGDIEVTKPRPLSDKLNSKISK